MTNEGWEEFLQKHPLARFSYYLNGRVWVLSEVKEEIIENLDGAFVDKTIFHEKTSRAEMLFWLWSLGAYEVIRTMHQAKSCFSDRVQNDLFALKKELAAVRMPNAKMEKAGKKVPVPSGRSASGINVERKDLLVGEPQDDISARDLILKTSEFFASISDKDVISTHEGSYKKS